MATTSRPICLVLSLLVIFYCQSVLSQPYSSQNLIQRYQPSDSIYDKNYYPYSNQLFEQNDDHNDPRMLPLKRSQDAQSPVNELQHLASERNAAFPKRPLGFMGPRGKKIFLEQIRAMMLNNNNNNNNNNLNHNHLDEEDDIDGDDDAPSSDVGEPKRMGMRGRKDIALTEAQLQQLRQFIQQQRDEYFQEINVEGGATPHMLRADGKRDPLKGFLASRGKRILKQLSGMGLGGEEQVKRSGILPTMGFVGMRGKKWANPRSTSEETYNS